MDASPSLIAPELDAQDDAQWASDSASDTSVHSFDPSDSARIPPDAATTPPRKIKRRKRYVSTSRKLQDFNDLLAELDRLIKHEYFGKLNSTMELETLDFSKPFEIVKEIAPMWFSLLTTLLQDPHAQGKDYSTESAPESIQKEVYTITSMVCHSRAKVRSEHLCSLMDVYLLGSAPNLPPHGRPISGGTRYSVRHMPWVRMRLYQVTIEYWYEMRIQQ
ncbi:hypothetical protein M8818_005079 [Zalaria obscura]|uniref:Uncharacterized protein n=1 Tax=Zalaria obscura TaxID=2024903 RepID=A0ACC3SAZ9_9PEZI